MRYSEKRNPSFRILLSAVAVTFFVGCANKAAQQGFERPPAAVSVTAAVAQDVPTYPDAIGRTVAREVVSIQPQVSGRIMKIHFIDGADVKKNDMLFTIDSRPFEASLRQAQANVSRDNALKKQAEANLAREIAQAKWGEVQLKRYRTLVDQGIVPREQYEQMRANQDSLNANVGSANAAVHSADEAIRVDTAAVESAKVQLSYCFIRSPIDGRAGQRLVEVQLQMRAERLRTEVRLPETSDEPVIGQLTFLNNAVENTTGTVNLRATIPNAGHRFWPGRFVNIRLVLSTIHGAVLIPANAPQMSGKGSYVYIVKQDSTVEQRPVSLGQRQGDLIVVEKGVEAGERVVTNGQLGVTPGGKVRIDQPANSPAAGNGAK